MTCPTKQTKGKWLTIAQQWQVIEEHERLQPPPSLDDLARWSQANATTVKSKLDSACTPKGRSLTLRCPELDERLASYVEACHSQHTCLSRRLITFKARQILATITTPPPPLKLSDGWLTRFMNRHNLRFRETHGEAGSVDLAAVEEGRLAMQDITRHYALPDIWNMDESGLFYRAAKSRGICKPNTKGIKKDKTRITIALVANADGSEKREAIFIGKAKCPKCFGKKTGEALDFYYRNNKKAWMTIALYSEWIREFDREMRRDGRGILLLVGGASSHMLDDIETGALTNITVQKLPPNTTSYLQPMDAGIIVALKAGYRDKHMELVTKRNDPEIPEMTPKNKAAFYVDQLQAMRWTVGVWAAMEAKTIANCLRKTGISFPEESAMPAPPTRRERIQLSELLI